ncbi:hypothetical protein RA307_19150 [Xanthobacteraceae bacterium Astr-EGSB]|uniref:hypothetical protein n=1 Tax=Astrobacterium formosum TaxID=3069710 RepID=UPI0027B1DB0C|nr:hypothetical protein [Xanthobacteraceae bacterium Astr-EGSB]
MASPQPCSFCLRAFLGSGRLVAPAAAAEVRFHEPAKWAARLLARKTDANPIRFLSGKAIGHSGFSGRLGFVHEQAQTEAWLLSMVGKGGRHNDASPSSCPR